MNQDGLTRFVSVKYRKYSKSYDYLCPQEWAKVGCFVYVPVGPTKELKSAKITKVFFARPEDMELPLYVYKTVYSLVPDFELGEALDCYNSAGKASSNTRWPYDTVDISKNTKKKEQVVKKYEAQKSSRKDSITWFVICLISYLGILWVMYKANDHPIGKFCYCLLVGVPGLSIVARAWEEVIDSSKDV